MCACRSSRCCGPGLVCKFACICANQPCSGSNSREAAAEALGAHGCGPSHRGDHHSCRGAKRHHRLHDCSGAYRQGLLLFTSIHISILISSNIQLAQVPRITECIFVDMLSRRDVQAMVSCKLLDQQHALCRTLLWSLTSSACARQLI